MAFHIPKSVKIGGLMYKIEWTEVIEHCGETNNKDLTIRLKKDCQKESIEATFLHELLHAINGEKKEEEVEFLAMALYQFIVDNPTVFKNGK